MDLGNLPIVGLKLLVSVIVKGLNTPPEVKFPPYPGEEVFHIQPSSTQVISGTTPAIVTKPKLANTQETIEELRRRLGKELYKMELDLAGGGRIAGKPCDCQPGDSLVYVNGDMHPVITLAEVYKNRARRIFSHRGQVQRITDHMVRNHTGIMRNIDLVYFGSPFRATPEHPVLVAKDGWRWNWRTHGGLNESQLAWVHARDITDGDFMVFPRILETRDMDIITPDLAEILGWYLAEGCKVENRITISLGYHELNHIDRVIQLFVKTFGVEPKTYHRRTCLHLAYTHKEFCLFFEAFGSNALEKHLPPWFMYLPSEKQGRLLKGLFSGDGCITSNEMHYATVSKDLAYQIHMMLFRLGILHGFRCSKTPDGIIEGRLIKTESNTYTISIAGDAMSRLNAICDFGWRVVQSRTLRNKGWAGEGYMFLPVRCVKDEEYNGPVYNVCVAEDESYLTPHGIAHNCLADKHHFGVEATAEEIMSYEHKPVYGQIIGWYKSHVPDFQPTEIMKHDPEYYRGLIPQVRAYRKDVMGTEKVTSLLTLEQQKQLQGAGKLSGQTG